MHRAFMPKSDQEIFHELNKVKIQEIHSLVDKARLLRNDQLTASNDLLEKAFELADHIRYKEGKGVTLRELSINYLKSRNFKSSIKSLEQSAHHFSQAGD